VDATQPGGRHDRPMGILAGVLLALAILPVSARAQTLRGTVLDDATNQPIAGVRIVLLSQDGDSLSTFVARDGRFRVELPAMGRYRVRTQRLGYLVTETGTFDVAPGEEITITVRMGVDALPLEPLRVEVHTPIPLAPQLVDFHARRRTGFGRFITREDIEGRPNATVAELLRSVAGVRLSETGIGVPIIELSRSLTRPPRPRRRSGTPPTPAEEFLQQNDCPVTLMVDGVVLSPKMMEDAGLMIDSYRIFFSVHSSDIEGIEIYRGLAELPGAFATPEAQRCGLVAIWLRRSPP